MDADKWEGSLPVVTGPAAETAGLSACLLAGEDGGVCLPPAEIMMTVLAEVLLHYTQIGFLGEVAMVATCLWDTHTEQGKI